MVSCSLIRLKRLIFTITKKNDFNEIYLTTGKSLNFVINVHDHRVRYVSSLKKHDVCLLLDTHAMKREELKHGESVHTPNSMPHRILCTSYTQ